MADARDVHLQIVESARRRNERERDIEDPAEFERFMTVVERLGKVADESAKDGISPSMTGRAMLYYAKCLGYAERPKSTIVPEAA